MLQAGGARAGRGGSVAAWRARALERDGAGAGGSAASLRLARMQARRLQHSISCRYANHEPAAADAIGRAARSTAVTRMLHC